MSRTGQKFYIKAPSIYIFIYFIQDCAFHVLVGNSIICEKKLKDIPTKEQTNPTNQNKTNKKPNNLRIYKGVVMIISETCVGCSVFSSCSSEWSLVTPMEATR